ncbi:MAG: alpha/beta hydrolase [Clostridia bacterium]|nr:alpha/beta hydrolase [Clostridia bacterium]
MENIITYETLSSFAHTNAPIVKTPVRGIVLVFNGLGFSSMFSEYDDESKRLADLGIRRVIPYYNPWCWMNRQTVDYVDELVDVLTGKFDLPDDIPVVATGGSMGGQCALVYCAYARRTPAAGTVNCRKRNAVSTWTSRSMPFRNFNTIFTHPTIPVYTEMV